MMQKKSFLNKGIVKEWVRPDVVFARLAVEAQAGRFFVEGA